MVFASYGLPENFVINAQCHAVSSIQKVSEIFLGQNNAVIQASNAIFGDPCGGIVKRLQVVLEYGDAQYSVKLCNDNGLTITDSIEGLTLTYDETIKPKVEARLYHQHQLMLETNLFDQLSLQYQSKSFNQESQQADKSKE